MPPKVIWLIDSLCMGGAERLAQEFAAAIDPASMQVELVALREGSGMLRANCPQHVIGARNLRDRAAFERLCHLLRRRGAQVLHTHLRYSHLWGGLAARRIGIPWVSTLHVLPQPAQTARERVLATLERVQLNRACARVLAVSQAQAEAWRHAGLDTPRLQVLPNGVALQPHLLPAERNAERARLGLPIGATIFLTVAVVRGLKGWRDLLRAVPAICAAHPDSHFVWVGAGPEFADLQHEVVARGLSGVVHLPGQRDDVPRWLQTADVFLFPSHEEALPTALLEAMGAGLPVVASRLPAVEEVLRDPGRISDCSSAQTIACTIACTIAQTIARTIAPGDADGLAREALQLAASAAVRQCEGEILRQRVVEYYGTHAWVDRLITTYHELLAEPNRGRRHAAPAPPIQAPALPLLPSSQPRLLAVERVSRGGLFHYTAQLTQGLARQGAQVTLLTGRNPEVGRARIEGVRVLPHLWGWNPHRHSRWLPRRVQRAGRGLVYLAGWMQVVAAIRIERPDVVLLGDIEHRCDAWFIAWLARGGWTLVDIWHNVVSFDRYGGRGVVRKQPWRNRIARHFHTIFVHGESLAHQLEQATGCRAVVIPHGNQDWIARQAGPDPDLNRQLSLPPDRPVALLFGSLTRYKGIDVLLEALSRLPAGQRPIAVLAGYPLADCPIDELRRQAHRSGLDNWVRWQIGYIPTPEIAWYFRRADVVVLPYRAASQSGVAHLALTFGKPMIVTATGSLPELMAGESNGLVVEPGDADALAAALARITGNDGLRERMGLAARHLAETRHNWDAIARQVLSALLWERPPGHVTAPAQTGATP